MKNEVHLTSKAAKCQRSTTNAIDKKQSDKREYKVDKGSRSSKPYCRRCVLNPRHPDDCCTVIPSACMPKHQHQFLGLNCCTGTDRTQTKNVHFDISDLYINCYDKHS